MAEFTLDRGTPESARTFEQLDTFTQAYIEAMFWTDANSDSDDCADATFADMAPEALKSVIEDCAAFQTENAALLAAAYATDNYGGEEQAGHDFWLTRNGHGAGFWDRGIGWIGDKLSDACRHQNLSLYRGDDGLIYLA